MKKVTVSPTVNRHNRTVQHDDVQQRNVRRWSCKEEEKNEKENWKKEKEKGKATGDDDGKACESKRSTQ